MRSLLGTLNSTRVAVTWSHLICHLVSGRPATFGSPPPLSTPPLLGFWHLPHRPQAANSRLSPPALLTSPPTTNLSGQFAGHILCPIFEMTTSSALPFGAHLANNMDDPVLEHILTRSGIFMPKSESSYTLVKVDSCAKNVLNGVRCNHDNPHVRGPFLSSFKLLFGEETNC